MSPPESSSDSADTVTDSKITDGIALLTGEDPALGPFLLVVGMVTCVFVAVFQLTLPIPIAYLLSAGVLFVTALSIVFALVLNTLGHFE
ncbi:hypothetical protein [Halocatena marina]|uniref:Cox cluster protein n=1 Tax=Halocatena marina TaxID=2934937 RepID=A0ABD5YM61_9EURY|nr:hypothetical protein [Halocatena marina]